MDTGALSPPHPIAIATTTITSHHRFSIEQPSSFAPFAAPAAARQAQAQAQAVEAYTALEARLVRYRPGRGGLLQRLFADKDATAPRGLYVYGEVGRGKTMLMDLFYGVADTAPKRRVHFHAFMQDVHKRLHAARQSHAQDAIAFAASETLVEPVEVIDLGQTVFHPKVATYKSRRLVE